MIPKIIHYCWFGRKPLPKSARKCIASWRKFFPDYEIKEWNEDNFDIDIIPYTRQAYDAKKYAFVSDYARMWVLYKYGGLYFDTDVEVIRPFDDILERGPFMGCEIDTQQATADIAVAPGLGLGVNPGLGLYKEILDFYEPMDFQKPDGTTMAIVRITTQALCSHGLRNVDGIQYVAGVYVYPRPYFNPLQITPEGKFLKIEECTHSIHHYTASWYTPRQRFVQSCKYALMKILGGRNVRCVINLLRSKK